MKILVIEDQPVIRQNVAIILEMEGYAVISAPDGAAGLELARTEDPDLIICDILMPLMDGHDVIRALRADRNTATIPFIFLTAKAEKPDIRAGMNLGADDFLAKPVDRQELIAAVAARLERQRAMDERLRAGIAARAAAISPDFSSSEPLEMDGITSREAEVLLWATQGKSNGDIAAILDIAEKTVKKHMGRVFEKLGVENRHGAAMWALERLQRAHSHALAVPPP